MRSLLFTTDIACGRLTASLPLPQASNGLPSPVMRPITRSASARSADESAGRSRPAAVALTRIISARPPEPVTTEIPLPRGQRSPWQTARTSVISSRSLTSIARCAFNTSENTRDSPANPPQEQQAGGARPYVRENRQMRPSNAVRQSGMPEPSTPRIWASGQSRKSLPSTPVRGSSGESRIQRARYVSHCAVGQETAFFCQNDAKLGEQKPAFFFRQLDARRAPCPVSSPNNVPEGLSTPNLGNRWVTPFFSGVGSRGRIAEVYVD
jgi:hypothetical protein